MQSAARGTDMACADALLHLGVNLTAFGTPSPPPIPSTTATSYSTTSCPVLTFVRATHSLREARY
eukprot:1800805-Rhodomonas_salina.1